MPEDQRPAALLVEAIAIANDRLAELARMIRKKPSMTSATSRIDIRNYASGLCVEMFVNSEHSSGNTITWWIEMKWKETNWEISGQVLIDSDEGQDAVRKTDRRVCESLSATTEALSAVTNQVIAWSDVADVSDPVSLLKAR